MRLTVYRRRNAVFKVSVLKLVVHSGCDGEEARRGGANLP